VIAAPCSIVVERGVPIPMRDGVILRADVWRSADGAPSPVLLQRLPYNKSDVFQAQFICGMEPVRAAEAGFVVIAQDTRGRFTSDGEFVPFVHEAEDAVDTIAWIRSRPYANGQVGMFGASYVGATQLLAASAAPEGLVAIVPQLTAAEYYDTWSYVGGAMQLSFLLQWVFEVLAGPDVARRPEGEPASRAAKTLAALLEDPQSAFRSLPIDRPELAELAPYYADWVRHPTRDAYWQAIDPSARHSEMRVAGLHVAGWNDLFLEGSLRTYRGLREHAATSWARENQYLVVGPWSHGNLMDWQGDHWFGYGANIGALDMTAQQLAFFGAAFAGSTAPFPRVRYFLMGADEWRTSEDWPPPGVVERSLFLRSTGWEDARHGRLTAEAPAAGEAPLSYRSDPLDPVPTVGGATFLPGLLHGRNSGPKDQSCVEARDDVLVYTTDPLETDLTVAGTVRLELHAASSATDCDWTARLVDVRPDGTAYGVVDGILRARYRDGLDTARPLVPNLPECFEVTLGTTAMTFQRGHRIRLQVASSNFPRFDRNPQQFIEVATAGPDDFLAATQVVFGDAARASRLVLSVLSDNQSA